MKIRKNLNKVNLSTYYQGNNKWVNSPCKTRKASELEDLVSEESGVQEKIWNQVSASTACNQAAAIEPSSPAHTHWQMRLEKAHSLQKTKQGRTLREMKTVSPQSYPLTCSQNASCQTYAGPSTTTIMLQNWQKLDFFFFSEWSWKMCLHKYLELLNGKGRSSPQTLQWSLRISTSSHRYSSSSSILATLSYMYLGREEWPDIKGKCSTCGWRPNPTKQKNKQLDTEDLDESESMQTLKETFRKS